MVDGTIHWMTPKVIVVLIQGIVIYPLDSTQGIHWINHYSLDNSIDVGGTVLSAG